MKNIIATCINDQDEVRFGFLWLKKRLVKNPRITSGKTYKVLNHTVTHYSLPGLTYVAIEILDDTGNPWWYLANGKFI